MKLKSNMDMFAQRGDVWDNTKMKDFFQPERIQHVKPGDGVWSKVTARSGFFRLDGELSEDGPANNPDMDRWLAAGWKSPIKQKIKANPFRSRKASGNVAKPVTLQQKIVAAVLAAKMKGK